jgi:predicted HAD superfamily Cof-like phosphohydrolase
MNRQIEQVKKFHQAFGHPVRLKPTALTEERSEMRMDILKEEIDELDEAASYNDFVNIADAIVDSMYILIGTALEYGIAHRLEECFEEVHRSNMSKLGADGFPVYREDGKIMKGPNYTPPNLAAIIIPDKYID